MNGATVEYWLKERLAPALHNMYPREKYPDIFLPMLSTMRRTTTKQHQA